MLESASYTTSVLSDRISPILFFFLLHFLLCAALCVAVVVAPIGVHPHVPRMDVFFFFFFLGCKL